MRRVSDGAREMIDDAHLVTESWERLEPIAGRVAARFRHGPVSAVAVGAGDWSGHNV